MDFNSVVLRVLEERVDLTKFIETDTGYEIPSSQTLPLFDVGEELYFCLVTPDYVSPLWLLFPDNVSSMLNIKYMQQSKCDEDHIYNTINERIKTTKHPFRSDEVLKVFSDIMNTLKPLHGTWYMQTTHSAVAYNGRVPAWEFYVIKHVDLNSYSKGNHLAGELLGF